MTIVTVGAYLLIVSTPNFQNRFPSGTPDKEPQTESADGCPALQVIMQDSPGPSSRHSEKFRLQCAWVAPDIANEDGAPDEVVQKTDMSNYDLQVCTDIARVFVMTQFPQELFEHPCKFQCAAGHVKVDWGISHGRGRSDDEGISIKGARGQNAHKMFGLHACQGPETWRPVPPSQPKAPWKEARMAAASGIQTAPVPRRIPFHCRRCTCRVSEHEHEKDPQWLRAISQAPCLDTA